MAKDQADKDISLRLLQFVEGLLLASILLRVDVWILTFDGPRVFTVPTLLNCLVLLLDIVALWLMLNRKHAAKAFAIWSSVFDIVALCAVSFMRGGVGTSTVVLVVMDILFIAYFLRSQTVRQLLVNPFSIEERRQKDLADRQLFDPRSFSFWRNGAIYFCVFSVVGHWMEIPYCMFMNLFGIVDQESLVWDNPMYPFMVYGFGIIACMLLCIPLRDKLLRKCSNLALSILIFYGIAVALSMAMELGMGLLLNQPVDEVYPLWDNSKLPFNILHQAWLVNDLLLGAVVLVITWLVLPACQRLLSRVPETALNVIAVAVVISFIALSVITYLLQYS